MIKKKLVTYFTVVMLLFSAFVPFPETTSAYGLSNHDTVVDAGKNHLVVLKSDGSVWAWGDHSYGQLGAKGFRTQNPIPIQLADNSRLANIKSIAAGGDHTIALDELGNVWTWGLNNFGQLGYSTGVDSWSSSPAQVPGLLDIVAIAAGHNHTLAVDKNGYVYAWGDNVWGQISDSDIEIGKPVSSVNQIVAVAAGAHHSVALKSDGTVWTWGRNSAGQLGNDQTTDQNVTATIVPGLTGIMEIAAGAYHTLALKQDKTMVYAWGSNTFGQLGDGGMQDKLLPMTIESVQKVKRIAAGPNHTIVVKEDGTVWTWGKHTSGTLTMRANPIQIKGISNAIAIGGGGDSNSYTLAVNEDGTVWKWDQFSSDSTTKEPIFTKVSGIDEVMTKHEFPFVQGSQVLFRYIGNATTVEVNGDFNSWTPIPMQPKGGGVWEVQLPTMPAGEYLYGFRVDGVWTVDPLNRNKYIDPKDRSPYSMLSVLPYATETPIISNKEVTFAYSSYDYNGLLELDAKTTYVAVIGDFNNFQEVPLTKQSNNIWTVTLPVDPGNHVYSFVVRDASVSPNKEVRLDPLNSNVGTNPITNVSNNRFFVADNALSTIPVSSISLGKNALNLVVGETAVLTPTVLPSNATNKSVSWYSSHPEVVAVDESGKLTAHTSGIAVIFVTSVTDGTKRDSVTVNVSRNNNAVSYPRVGFENMGDRTGVSDTKAWKIKLSDPIDASSINMNMNDPNNNNIYIVDESNNKLPIGYRLLENDKTIEINLQRPAKFTKGANYYLFIEKTVKRKDGTPLSKPVQMKFTIGL